MIDSGSTHDVTVEIGHNEDGDLTINNFILTDTIDYSVTSGLPLNIPPGSQGSVSFQIHPDTTSYYKNPFEITYSVDGFIDTISGDAPAAIFIDDQSETAFIAKKTLVAYNAAKNNDEPVSLANNTGVIYRLLGEYKTAEGLFQMAIDSSLTKGYGFGGIKMNLGVVNSDMDLSTEANDLYNEAYSDIADNESGSALAPQIYYNQAWEAYEQSNGTLAADKANQVIAHSMANDYLKAKAYTLLGAIETGNDNYPKARENFREAIDLDSDGAVGQLAMDNLYSISRPQILEEPTSQLLCEGDSTVLKIDVFGEAPYSFNWYHGENLIKSGTNESDSIIIMDFSASNDGNYRCEIDNEFGACTSSVFTLTIVIPEKPEITPAGDTSICESEAVILTAPSATDYLWSNGAVTRSIRATDSGSYSLIIKDENGCVSPASDSVKINVNALPEKPSITILGNILVSSSTFGNQWFLENTIIIGEVEQEFTVPQDGNYHVIVKDEKGCSNTSEAVYIAVTDVKSTTGNSIFSIYPNPNDGSFNLSVGDGFKKEKIELRLYNTNGRMVMNKILHYPQDSDEYYINTPDLISGLYHLQIVIGEKIHDEVIIIQR
jgi:tetratricopeptide (TPR) repeat protein